MVDDSASQRAAAIVLAAGASTRLGTPKQLVLYQGEPLLRRAARSALEAGASPVLVVLAPALHPSTHLPSHPHNRLDRSAHTVNQTTPSSTIMDTPSAPALAGLPVILVANPERDSGMGSSLRAGMGALLALPSQPSKSAFSPSAPGSPVLTDSASANSTSMNQAPPDRVLLLVSDQPLVTPEHLRLLLAAPAPDGIVAAVYNGRLGVPAVFSRQHFAALAAVEGDHGARALLRTLPATPFDLPEAAVDIDTPDDLRHLITQTL